MRPSPLGREDAGDDRHRLRRHHRTPHPLQGAGNAQLGGILGQATEGGCHREQRHAREEEAPGTEDVAEPAGGDKERRKHQDVGVQDPQDLIERGVYPLDDEGNGDIDDGGIEQGHEQP
jgi:hypothetical protein